MGHSTVTLLFMLNAHSVIETGYRRFARTSDFAHLARTNANYLRNWIET